MAQITAVDTPFGWDAPYHFSQAVIHGDTIYLSGQAALAQDGSIVGEGDFAAQAHQVFANLQTVLRAAGSDLSRVIKVNIYLTDMANFPVIVECRQRYFSKPYPADTTVQVKALAIPGLLLEIDVVAAR